jgi:hypothetical protein
MCIVTFKAHLRELGCLLPRIIVGLLAASECTQLLAFGDANLMGARNIDYDGLDEERIILRGQVIDRDAENHQLSNLLLLNCLSPRRSSCPDSLPPIASIPSSSISSSPSSSSSVRHRLQVRLCRALHTHTKTVNAGPALTCKRGCRLDTVSSVL